MHYQGVKVIYPIPKHLTVTPVTNGDKAYCPHGYSGDDSDTPLKGCHMSPAPLELSLNLVFEDLRLAAYPVVLLHIEPTKNNNHHRYEQHLDFN